MTTQTTITTNNAGSSPAPREAHQRADISKGEMAMTAPTIKGLLKVLAGLLLWTGLISALTFWISPILGTITVMCLAFLWTFFVAPRLAGQMVAALILARSARKAGR